MDVIVDMRGSGRDIFYWDVDRRDSGRDILFPRM
jgi:hypothetical protein